MKQMGVETPVFGFVSDYMARPDGSEIKVSELIHPKVEAEICIVTKAPLRGPGCHVGTVMAAVDFVLPAVEVIDSRYRDFKFDLKSVIADNTSSSRFVVGGRPRDLDELDLRTLGVVLEINGEVRTMAAGAAVLGHPLAAVAMLANHLGARGQEIPAGTFVMTGGVTEALAVQPGDAVSVRFQDLGTVSMRFV
jgi:2-oxo-3-hexenedioate decarboxylase